MKVEYEIQPNVMTVVLDKQEQSAAVKHIDVETVQPVSLAALRDALPMWREFADKYSLNLESLDALAIDLKEIENGQNG